MRKHASTWLCSLLINKWNWILFTFLFFWIPEDWKFLCWNFGWATWWIRTFQGWTICQRKQPQVTTLWKSLQQNWLFQNWVKSVMRRRSHWWPKSKCNQEHQTSLTFCTSLCWIINPRECKGQSVIFLTLEETIIDGSMQRNVAWLRKKCCWLWQQ